MIKKAVVLTSGGVDSITCLAIALSQGFECYTLSFDYGQKNRAELKAARNLSHQLGAKAHQLIQLPIGHFGGSALTDPSIVVPHYKETEEIPVTYVPARNSIFLSIALAYAETINAYDIFIGVNAIDYSHYPDCRPEFIAQFQKLVNLATKQGMEGANYFIHAPIIQLSKADIIRCGIGLGVDYSQTISCYRADDNGLACGQCHACVLRKKGFLQAAIADPTKYI
jgi:7-cyano-7-deazaguanine synthase